MSERADFISRTAKGLTPFVMGLFGVFILALPIRLAGGIVPMPILPLVIIYFWTIYDPQRLPSSLVLLIGLFQDALSGTPFGLWSTVYLVVQFIVLSQRDYFLGRDLIVVWAGFLVIGLGAATFIWLVMSLMAGYQLPVRALSIQMAVTVLFYPVLGIAFRQIRRFVLMEVSV